MAQRKPIEKTHKFLEITDPKKAVGLWSYYAVRETAMTPVGTKWWWSLERVNVTWNVGGELDMKKGMRISD